MQKEIILQYFLDRQSAQGRRSFIPRELRIDLDFHRQTGKIAAILGTRRSGKSTYLLQLQQQMGLDSRQAIWMDFTEYLWQDFQASDWKLLWESALEICAPYEPVFFLDEIQQVADFESGLRYLQNQNALIIITGSNSSLFNRNLAESLRGKVLSYDLFPLSFREFLLFRNWENETLVSGTSLPLDSRKNAQLNNLLDEYLQWGGFPEVVLAADPELKLHLLKSYVDTMLLRDVVERHEIKNIVLVEKLFQKALLSFTKTFSVHKWYNDFKSQGMRLSKDTLYDYLHYLEESLFLITLQNSANSAAARKIYLIDNGLYQTIRPRADKGQLWENACLLELLRSGIKPGFWLDDQGEIDFITPSELIQVSLELHGDNLQREQKPLQRLAQRFPDARSVLWLRSRSDAVSTDSDISLRYGL
ncbi:ATP-binding protein [Spirochaeta dissipatitropha]